MPESLPPAAVEAVARVIYDQSRRLNHGGCMWEYLQPFPRRVYLEIAAPYVAAALPHLRAHWEGEVRDAIEAEPEMPDDMPDEMWELVRADRDAAQESGRIAVRLTKEGILDRMIERGILRAPTAPSGEAP